MNSTNVEIVLNLHSPHYTDMHAAGLAGLWMTLRQFNREGISYDKLKWDLGEYEVALNIQGSHLEAIEWLIQQSFLLNDGLIGFRGIDSENLLPESRVALHQGLLNTFLQQGILSKSDGIKSQSFEIDEGELPLVVSYKSLTEYSHQKFAKNLCDRAGFLLEKPLAVAGWLNPGATVKHTAFAGKTSIEQNALDALVLLYAPVVCCYFKIRSFAKGEKASAALIIPEILNLKQFAETRMSYAKRHQAYKNFHASGIGDAALRFLVTYESAVEIAKTYKVSRCRAVIFGKTPWNQKQKSPTDKYSVTADAKICAAYQKAQNAFKDKYVVYGDSGSAIVPSLAKGLIADALIKHLPWYGELAEKITSKELFDRLCYESKGFRDMVEYAEWKEASHGRFVEACHDALRGIYAGSFKQGNAEAKRQNASEEHGKNLGEKRISDEREKVRSKMIRCKNFSAFCSFITEFWSKAGFSRVQQEYQAELWNLVLDDWEMARNLVLLSLVSYKGRKSPDLPPELPSSKRVEAEDSEVDLDENDGDEEEEDDEDDDDGESVPLPSSLRNLR
ncbi:type I-MYXAN CRISPR-associated Cas8a1/Cmx1 [Microcoleus sp. LAD1_D3]|uniref:type I-MYXAN CRISPR-associated Cas8a1/Cmx1 n=1 Tax=Microcoleus sp. LAD1_D3 TaxID=2819365 RepID=UPI002FD1D44C